MKYKIVPTTSFKKDFKRIKKRQYRLELLHDIIEQLANGETLSIQYKDHALMGEYAGFHECHIESDWLLIYKIQEDTLILVLTRTGTHSDIF